MPTFYFDVRDGYRKTDISGTDLPDMTHVRREAVKRATAYLHDDPDMIWDGHELRVLVRDENGILITTVVISAQ